MNKRTVLNIAILISGMLIICMQVLLSSGISGFKGTDDQSVDIINEIAPNYKPWISNVLEFQSDWSETLMFAIQAALGLCIIIFYILKQRNKIKSV